MKILDVNVVVPAFREDHADHELAHPWLEHLVATREQFAVPWLVWWSFLRITTNPRVFPDPSPTTAALGFIRSVRSQHGYLDIAPGKAHEQCLHDVCSSGEASGNLVPDAVLGALALEHGAEVVSFDRDFARFPGVRWSVPTR